MTAKDPVGKVSTLWYQHNVTLNLMQTRILLFAVCALVDVGAWHSAGKGEIGSVEEFAELYVSFESHHDVSWINGLTAALALVLGHFSTRELQDFEA